PSLVKFNWCFDGSWGSALNTKNGEMRIMRTADIYLIAAEASQQLGDAAAAAKYLEPLRRRATRVGATTPSLGTVTEDVIFDEYAREMAGELNRWALLKRHHAFESRLQKYNKRAAAFFRPDRHYLRPISADFLNQIDNKDQYGDNGYGTTPGKGF
ncbi:MAG: RagB/SusD family nutrient uptake outer membrane protein, partial [Duncaniella sp.]|nr:RagB/SusD family nutrient uptake outer membrane protein [Duncaniella sp.]